MAYSLNILNDDAAISLAELAEKVAPLIDSEGGWSHFFEVRMGAGPTVTIGEFTTAGLDVIVTWDEQYAESPASSLIVAEQLADRLATAFYEERCNRPRSPGRRQYLGSDDSAVSGDSARRSDP